MPSPVLERIQAKRRPRYRRVGERKRPALTLTNRDRELIKTIYEHRFVTSRQLQELVPGSAQGVLRRLQKLFHHHYVDRLKLSNNSPMIYAIGNRGADELAQYGIDRQKIDWTSKNHEVGEHYIHHSLMITRFRHALALALRERPEATLTFWEPSGSFKVPVSYEETVRTSDGGQRTKVMKTAVIPDGFFALSQGERTANMCLFLEADRSTMTNARYLAKLKGYYHYWKTHVRTGQDASGIRGFRVLTVTLSHERKDNLRESTKEGLQKIDGRGLNLFWFACERDYQNTPHQLLASIWQTPADDTLRSILI